MPWNPSYQTQNVLMTAFIPVGAEPDVEDIKAVCTLLKPVWMVAQPEKCPETGKIHWQCFFHLPKKMANQKIERLVRTRFPLPLSVRFEAKLSHTTYQNQKDYCHKDESAYDKSKRFEHGTQPPEQGNRTDLAGMVERLREGATDLELLEENPAQFMIHNKAFALVRRLLAPKRDAPSKLIFVWGKTGNGKTMTAMLSCVPPPEMVEWDAGRFLLGYTGSNTAVVFDDFAWPGMEIRKAFRVCDRWPLEIGTKGSSIQFAPKIIIFTSNDDPMKWWPDATPEHRAAWHRRIADFGTVIHLESKLAPSEAQGLLTQYFPKAVVAPPPSGPAGSATSLEAVAGSDVEVIEEVGSGDDMGENSDPSDHEIREVNKRKGPKGKGPAKKQAPEPALKKTKTVGGPMDGFMRKKPGYAAGCKRGEGCTTDVCFC